MQDQTALQTDGIDDLLEQFPRVGCEMDAGYRGLCRDHPRPGRRPAGEARPGRGPGGDGSLGAGPPRQSPARICVGHAVAGSKCWRPLQRWPGRREDLPETVRAIGSLVSGRAAAW
ncbi:MAG: hypothetical protein ACRDUT_02305 [Mycobacterium sp.]